MKEKEHDDHGTEPRPIVTDAVNMIQAVIDFPLDRETRDAIEGIVQRVVTAVQVGSATDSSQAKRTGEWARAQRHEESSILRSDFPHE